MKSRFFADIWLGGHIDLHVFYVVILTGVKYRDDTLDPYIRPHAGAIGNDFILIDVNAQPLLLNSVYQNLIDSMNSRCH